MQTSIYLELLSTMQGWMFPNAQRTQDVNVRVKSELYAMKALSSMSFGHSGVFYANYKQYIRPILSYASSAWYPDFTELCSAYSHRLYRIDSDDPRPCWDKSFLFEELLGSLILSMIFYRCRHRAFVHEEIHKSIDARKHKRTTSTLEYTVLRPPLSRMPKIHSYVSIL